jgi:septal ring factor EnvC (AmiA/AmiB activator)
MFGGSLLSNLFMAAAAVAGFAAGAMLSRLLALLPNGPTRKRADDFHHTIRGLEAELRVAQRTAEQTRAERDGLTAELGKTTTELAEMREKAATSEDRLRKLRAEIQHECAKTARLRRELADRAEEMVRTHVQLRDVQNELGVSQVGTGVVMEEMTRLERERGDLDTIVKALRTEMAARPGSQLVRGASPVLDQGGDLAVDC